MVCRDASPRSGFLPRNVFNAGKKVRLKVVAKIGQILVGNDWTDIIELSTLAAYNFLSLTGIDYLTRFRSWELQSCDGFWVRKPPGCETRPRPVRARDRDVETSDHEPD